MVDEDFVMGYCVGYNDGVGSGGSGGIIIKDGATVYDVPILHNYSLIGTDFGLATFDVNECAFLNQTPKSDGYGELQDYKNQITGEIKIYKRSQPCGGIYRSMAYAITKGGKAIGIYKAGNTSYSSYHLRDSLIFTEDGNVSPMKDRYFFSKVINPILTFEDVPSSTQTNLKVYLEWDEEERTIAYNAPQRYYNNEYGFYYYLKSELEVQTVKSDDTSTIHRKTQIANFNRVLSADNYPEEWLNKYRIHTNVSQTLQNPIFGISIMDNFELTTSVFDGIA